MRKIYKFNIRTPVNVSKDYKILYFGSQDGELFIWAETNPEAEQIQPEFLIAGTGFSVPEEATYIGTDVGDTLVWHLYEKKR